MRRDESGQLVPFNKRKARQQRAMERQAERATRTAREQLRCLTEGGYVAVRERARLIEQAKPKRSTEPTATQGYVNSRGAI